jgi:LacI family transcriptional regulator
MCRHAAGILRGLGHQRIAMLSQKQPRAGDLDSEAGFIEGARLPPGTEAEVFVIQHEPTVDGVTQALRRLVVRTPAPTALLITNSYSYLTVASRLAQYGVRIPQDISLISRDADPFLSFIVPQPAHYFVQPQLMAKNLLRPTLELLSGARVTQRAFQVIPRFVRGESIATPSQAPLFRIPLA